MRRQVCLEATAESVRHQPGKRPLDMPLAARGPQRHQRRPQDTEAGAEAGAADVCNGGGPLNREKVVISHSTVACGRGIGQPAAKPF